MVSLIDSRAWQCEGWLHKGVLRPACCDCKTYSKVAIQTGGQGAGHHQTFPNKWFRTGSDNIAQFEGSLQHRLQLPVTAIEGGEVVNQLVVLGAGYSHADVPRLSSGSVVAPESRRCFAE